MTAPKVKISNAKYLHGHVLVFSDRVDQLLLCGGAVPDGLDQELERLARFPRGQGLRLEVAFLEGDQTLELNQKRNKLINVLYRYDTILNNFIQSLNSQYIQRC